MLKPRFLLGFCWEVLTDGSNFIHAVVTDADTV